MTLFNYSTIVLILTTTLALQGMEKERKRSGDELPSESMPSTKKLSPDQDAANKMLLEALSRKSLPRVRQALNAGANVNIRFRFCRPRTTGETPLQMAVARNRADIVRLLLEQRGIDSNAKDSSSRSALHHAAYRGSAEIMGLLLDHIHNNAVEIDPALPNELLTIIALYRTNSEALFLMAELNNRNLLACDSYDSDYCTPLYHAAYRNNVLVARELLRYGACANGNHLCASTPLHTTALHQAYEVAVVLLQAGADVNAKNFAGLTPMTCLHLMVESMKRETMRKFIILLLTYGASVRDVIDFKCLSTSERAVLNGDLNRLAILTCATEDNPELRQELTNLLPLAAGMGRVNIVQFLLDRFPRLLYGDALHHVTIIIDRLYQQIPIDLTIQEQETQRQHIATGIALPYHHIQMLLRQAMQEVHRDPTTRLHHMPQELFTELLSFMVGTHIQHRAPSLQTTIQENHNTTDEINGAASQLLSLMHLHT
jgi:ankyrin repeat protein